MVWISDDVRWLRWVWHAVRSHKLRAGIGMSRVKATAGQTLPGFSQSIAGDSVVPKLAICMAIRSVGDNAAVVADLLVAWPCRPPQVQVATAR